ncbi:hypothetical protein GH741_16135 [Aquibacillus halophilus]|uniref:Uncharacterized protein n=1 Tax=Aquibacillus halophilus TaxID=930132 RepID=A0A6A8DSH0_9BACI|nr:DUF6241 domain-containing protein [Aquibacillus halophilus]MRH44172.1 hypothetical protein [Aquibacillus halophilus]
MKKNKKKFIYLFSSVTVLVIGLIIWKTGSNVEEPVEISEEELEEIQEEQVDIQASNEENFENETTPADELKKYETMSNDSILQEIHKMTHQKVMAKHKWGSVEITRQRVEKIYAEIEKKEDFQNQAVILNLLSPWLEGNFDNAVEVHNQVWSIQDGTIGKASRLLTPEEEREYINKHF